MRIGLFAKKAAGKSHELRKTVSIVTDLLSRGIELKRGGSPMATLAKKAPNPTDKHVGSRVRMRRMMLGMSQEKLGDSLGLTFQQVQKYEKGANRIGASRLQQISHILQVPVAFFFEGALAPHGSNASALSMAEIDDFVSDRLKADRSVHAN